LGADMVKQMRRVGVGVALGTLAFACNAIIGTRDLTYDANAGTEAGADAGIDAAGLADAPVPTPDTGVTDTGVTDTGTDTGSDAGCVADLSTSPDHCGACGHSCLGGACTAGVCKPVAVASGSDIRQLIEHGSNVYWVDATAGTVSRAAKPGGAAGTTVLGNVDLPTSLVTIGANLYVGGRDGVSVCPIATCQGNLTSASSTGVVALGTDGVKLFAATYYSFEIVRFDGAAPTLTPVVLDDPTQPGDVAADATYAYYTSQSTYAMRVKHDGTGRGTIGGANSSGYYPRILNSAARVYWTQPQENIEGSIASWDKGTGTALTIANAGFVPGRMALDATHLYWVTFGRGDPAEGSLRRCKLPCDGSPGQTAQTLVSGLGSGRGVAVDATAIHYASDTTVYRLAKPL